METDKDELIGMADIARMAGVTRATASNWKKRRPQEFPTERGRSARGPLYDPTEVASWLATRGTAKTTTTGDQRTHHDVNADLWRVVEAVEGDWRLRDVAPALLYGLSQELAKSNGHLDSLVAKVKALNPDLAPQFQQLCTEAPTEIEMLLSAVRESDDPLEFIWDAMNLLASVGRHWDYGTPAPIADLIAGLVEPAKVVYDPCVGTGHLVARVACRNSSDAAVYGQEINPTAAALATSVLEAAGLNSQIVLGDTVDDDQHGGLLADVVVAHPPFGMRLDTKRLNPDDIRWVYGTPRADTAWLQMGLFHLAPDGRMAILAPSRILFQQGPEGAIVRSIFRQNLLRAIISLPERTLATTGTAPVVLLLGDGWGTRLPGSPNPILMVDDSAFQDPNSTESLPLTQDAISRVTGTVRSWLEHGTEPQSPSFNLAMREDVLRNNWVLLPRRYRPRQEPTVHKRAANRPDPRTNLSKAVDNLTQRVEQYLQQDYDLSPGTPEWTTLGDLDGVTLIRGVANHDVFHIGEAPPVCAVIEPADLKGTPEVSRIWIGEHGTLLEPGDVLVKLEGPNIGESAQFTDDTPWDSCVAAPGVAAIRVEKPTSVMANYLAAWCASPSFRQEVDRLAIGSVRRRLRYQDFPAVAIAVPDRKAQQALGERATALAEITQLLSQVELDLKEFTELDLDNIVRFVEQERPEDT